MKKLLNATLLTLTAPLLMLSTGCFPFILDDDGDEPPTVDVPPPSPPPAPVNAAPTVSMDNVGWPPAGPETLITFRMSDDFGLSSMSVSFANDLSFPAFGISDERAVFAQELGEGFGTLELTVSDVDGLTTDVSVSDFLIDLSPPEITVGDTVLRLADDSSIELWGADAFVLGRMELSVGELTLTHDFNDVYPTTLGEAWHYEAVAFNSTNFAEGSHEAVVTLYDAAGNGAQTSVTLTLDGTAPTVGITSPAPDAVVSGMFDVVLNAVDDRDQPVSIELRIDGVPVAVAVGPQATVQLDAGVLTAGDAELSAVGTDDVGNESVFVTVPITIQ